MQPNQPYDVRLLLDYLKQKYTKSELSDLVFGTDLEMVVSKSLDLDYGDLVRKLLDYTRRVGRLDLLLQLLGQDRDRGELFRQDYEPRIRLAATSKTAPNATITSAVPERRFSGAEPARAELPVRKSLTAPADPSNKLMAHVQLLRETHERIKQEVARLEQCVDYRHKAEEINGCIEGLNEKTFELRDLLEQRRPVLPAAGASLDEFQRAIDDLRAGIDDYTRLRSHRDLSAQVGVILRLAEGGAVPQAAVIKARHDEIVGVRNSLMNISGKLGELKVDLRQNAYEVKKQCDDTLPQINALSQTLDGLMHDMLDFMMSLDGAIQASIRDLHELTTTEVYQVGTLEQVASVSAPAPREKFGAGPDTTRRSRTYASRRPRPGPPGSASSISNLPNTLK